MKETMEEIKKKLDSLNTKIEEVREMEARYVAKCDNIIQDIADEIKPLRVEYNKMVVEEWIERGKQGLNKDLSRDDLPIEVRLKWDDIYRGVKRDCIGYDCRGCDRRCAAETHLKFVEMFNL